MKTAVTATADRQLLELQEWWDENRPDASARVETSFAAVLKEVSEHPELGEAYPANPSYRTWRLEGTPYYAFYEVDYAREVVVVAAVWSKVRGRGPNLE